MILITNNGIFYNGWNKQPDTLIEKDINHYYSDSVVFSDNLTIGGFFQVFFKYKTTIEKDFISYTNCSNLQPFYDQMQRPATQYLQSSLPAFQYNGVVIKHSASISVHKIQDIKRNYVNSWDCLIGFDNTDVKFPIMGVTLESINNIKHLPLKLDVFYNLVQINPLDKDVVLATNLIHNFTLHDIISLMFTELTFIDDLDVELENLLSIDDLIEKDIKQTIQDKKNQLEIAKKKEQFERCSYLLEEITRLESLLSSQK